MLQRIRHHRRSLEIPDAFSVSEPSWSQWSGDPFPQPRSGRPTPGTLRQSDMLTPAFAHWMGVIRERPRFHNKQWQFLCALEAAHLLSSEGEIRAIGFGVGREPLTAVFASWGWSVLATDYLDGQYSNDWAATQQLSSQVLDLNERNICPEADFLANTQFQNLDMNTIPKSWNGQFDFVWSMCALGHIGGYEKGLSFIRKSADLLRPGGVAVHTTELDISEGNQRFDTPGLSLYRERDLVRTLQDIAQAGFSVPNHDFSEGYGFLERFVDKPPYSEPHLRLLVADRIVVPVQLTFSRPSD